MKDLHAEALAIAALREKVTQAPWIQSLKGESVLNLHDDGDSTVICVTSTSPHHAPVRRANAAFIAAAHRMADLIAAQDAKIAELLAAYEKRTAEASDLFAETMNLRSQLGASEAKLRELCEMEPVAEHTSYATLNWCTDKPLPPIGTKLISCPTMPESGK